MRELKLNNCVYAISGCSFTCSWKRVYKDEKILAHVPNTGTALQVVYQDVHENGGACEFLNIEDFIEVER